MRHTTYRLSVSGVAGKQLSQFTLVIQSISGDLSDGKDKYKLGIPFKLKEIFLNFSLATLCTITLYCFNKY